MCEKGLCCSLQKSGTRDRGASTSYVLAADSPSPADYVINLDSDDDGDIGNRARNTSALPSEVNELLHETCRRECGAAASNAESSSPGRIGEALV